MYDDIPGVNKKLDSHASFQTNRFIVMHKVQIDVLAYQAANSMHFSHINSFYNAVEIWYISLKDLMKEGKAEENRDYRTQIEKCRNIYKAIREKIETDGRYRNRKALQMLLDTAKQFYSLIITAMQEYQYFFRLSNISHKGLSNINFMDQSIFNTRAKNGKEKDN